MKPTIIITAVASLCLTTYVLAAPSLPVTKPPILPVPSWTGPLNDPHALQGQWFGQYGDEYGHEVRSHEFHDNVTEFGGGDLPDPLAFDSYRAIYGKVTNVVQSPGTGNITAFTVRARITNDTPALTPWLEGTNSHEEWAPSRQQYVGTLYETKLTAEFALSDLMAVPAAWVAPYRQGRLPFIYATNEDTQAWYCWTPGTQQPSGNFYVPTWDFGNIPMGMFIERDLQFAVAGAGLAAGDPRYGNIMMSRLGSWGEGDVFFNRTTDLKIGDWLDDFETFDGAGYPYPEIPLRGGNVSVFHNVPEPATLGLLLLGGLMLLRRRS
jgi:hypothetical protein